MKPYTTPQKYSKVFGYLLHTVNYNRLYSILYSILVSVFEGQWCVNVASRHEHGTHQHPSHLSHT